MKKLLLTGALTLAVCGVAQSVVPKFNIYSGHADTLYSASTVLVAATDPGSSVKIDGQDVKVYKTGSFAQKIDLKPGLNTVSVSINSPEGKLDKTLTIVRAERKNAPAKKSAHDPEATVMFADPVYVETKPLAYLQYGNGDDRLGGSKMGFVDEGIVLKVIGEKGSLYCVRLASDRIAYIPKSYTVPAVANGGVVNTGSWSVTNTGRTDRVVIALPKRLPYQYSTELDPSTITVDVFGATDNSNWITQRSLELGMIDYMDYRQIGEDTYRVILRLKDRYQWGFQVSYEGTNLVIEVRHTPKSLKIKDLLIGLDAGHGGQYPGAYSPSGLKEKDVNLDIILRVNALLTKMGARTCLTREGDTGPSMTERKQIWAKANVDLAISVHNNWTPDPFSAPGTSAYYKHIFDRPLALAMARQMMATGLNLYGVVGNFNFSLSGPTLYPNVLIEAMFMNSLHEEELLADPAFRQKVAEHIVRGLQDYLNQVEAARKSR